MNSLNNDNTRRFRVRGIVAYPAVTVALVVSLSLALTPFGPSQLSALAASPTPTPTSTATTPSPTPTVTTPSPTVASPQGTTSATTAPGLVLDPGAAFGDHHVLARIEGSQMQANYLPVDEPVLDALPHQRFRVRFRLHNAGTTATTMTPRLEYRTEGGGSFLVVPEQPEVGIPMHAAQEWIPSLDPLGGMMLGPLGADIAVADLRMGTEGGLGITGHRSMGANPDQPMTLPTDSYTEQEFTVELTGDAQYLSGYELRITDGGAPLTGTDVAVIRLGDTPAVPVNPDDRQGIAVADPTPSGSKYPLVASSASATTVAPESIHGSYSTTTDKCGICHRTHTAKAPNLLAKGSQTAMCLTCHDGTQAKANVQAQYALVRPANVNTAANRDFYSHDTAVAPNTHTSGSLNEFGGVSNRHGQCTDCHNPHQATATAPRDSAQTTTGWDASQRLAGVSGVSVVNGAAGAAPTYTFLNGVIPGAATNLVTREYQVCFKCHSGFTTLTSNATLVTAATPPLPLYSKFALDKGIEFNPKNPSFHPVEAPGTNQTTAMAASLAGTSPYKLWNFTIGSTIRCLNCHASSATPDPAPTAVPPLAGPGAGSSLPPHTSANRGILLRPYRDRLLKPGYGTGSAYSASDFALCYMCHAEAPFKNETGTATNFGFHGYHITALSRGGSTVPGIDTPGAGSGNAICAECHFRLHSTTNKVGSQVLTGATAAMGATGTRLVNFAPNVLPYNGTLSWSSTGVGKGSCTLTCHGVSHTPKTYSGAP